MSRLRTIVCTVLTVACLCGAAWAEPETSAGPVLRTELARDSAIVGQPITLTISVLVPTWMPKPPVFPSFEMPNLLVRLPEGASGPTSERVGGETWSGVARAYALSPMAARRFRIPALPVDITFADPKTRAPVRVRLRTDPVAFVGTIPPAARGLVPFLAAESLELEEEIEGRPDALEVGAAFTRTVTAKVRGTSPIFVPPLVTSLLAEGVAAYPKEPVVAETGRRGVSGGTRVERVTYVAESSARAAAPAVEIRWYNLRSEQVETASLASVEIVTHGDLVDSIASMEWREVGFRAAALTFAVVALVFVLRRVAPRLAGWWEVRTEVYRASEAYAYARVVGAMRAQRLGDTLGAVRHWSSRLPATHGPDDVRLDSALRGLGAALYGRERGAPVDQQWRVAQAALRAARRTRRAARRASERDHVLPPINPVG